MQMPTTEELPYECLGPFKLVRPIARGGMSDIYLGQNTGDWDGPDTVVLKAWHPPEDLSPNEEARTRNLLERLIEEGRLGTRLNHPAIARSYGVMQDQERGVYYLVQDYVDGATLGELIDCYRVADLRIPFNIVLRLLVPVLRALQYAHHEALREDGRPLRVVHRDVKPENVMLSYQGLVQLVDFGVARSTAFTRQATVGGMVVGTRYYMAPEQVFDPDKVGHRSDLFSVGLILFELCAIRSVFEDARTIKEFAMMLANFDFEEHRHHVDPSRYPGVQDVLAGVLQTNPASRYPSARVMAERLEILLHKAPEHPTLARFAEDLRVDLREASADDEPTVFCMPEEEPTVVPLAPVQRPEVERGSARVDTQISKATIDFDVIGTEHTARDGGGQSLRQGTAAARAAQDRSTPKESGQVPPNKPLAIARVQPPAEATEVQSLWFEGAQASLHAPSFFGPESVSMEAVAIRHAFDDLTPPGSRAASPARDPITANGPGTAAAHPGQPRSTKPLSIHNLADPSAPRESPRDVGVTVREGAIPIHRSRPWARWVLWMGLGAAAIALIGGLLVVL